MAPFFEREAPTWLTDPFKKRPGSTHLVVWTLQLFAVWFCAQGRHLPPRAFALALCLYAIFGVIVFGLRKRVCAKYGASDHMFIHSYYDIPEAYLNAYPLACAVLVFALDRRLDLP